MLSYVSVRYSSESVAQGFVLGEIGEVISTDEILFRGKTWTWNAGSSRAYTPNIFSA